MKLYFHVLTQRDVHVIWMPANLTHFVIQAEQERKQLWSAAMASR